MENASKALIIAGEVLIALLVISLGVYLIRTFRAPAQEYEAALATVEVARYNVVFERMIGRRVITMQEIISVRSFARDNEEFVGHTSITLGGARGPVHPRRSGTLNLNGIGAGSRVEINPERLPSGEEAVTWRTDEQLLTWGLQNMDLSIQPPMQPVFTVTGENIGARPIDGRINRISFTLLDCPGCSVPNCENCQDIP